MRTTEPTVIAKGERVEWKRSFSSYSSTDYSLQYRFRGDGPGADVTATASGSGYESAITAIQSAAFAVGTYKWQAWVTEIADATNTLLVAEGLVTVERGFEAGETGDIDLRSHAKIMLDTLDAALFASGSSDVVEYEITTPAGGRRVKREARSTVIDQRKYWAAIVSHENTAERLRNGGKFGKAIKVSMRVK